MEKTQFWETTSLLMGLKYDAIFVEKTLEGVMELKESSVWKAAVREGERNLILRQGGKRFGEPTQQIQRQLGTLNK